MKHQMKPYKKFTFDKFEIEFIKKAVKNYYLIFDFVNTNDKEFKKSYGFSKIDIVEKINRLEYKIMDNLDY